MTENPNLAEDINKEGESVGQVYDTQIINENETLRSYYSQFDEATNDPYYSTRRLASKKDLFNADLTAGRAFTQKEKGGRSVAEDLGYSLRASAPTYDRLAQSHSLRVGSRDKYRQFTVSDRTPNGMVFRPTEVHYLETFKHFEKEDKANKITGAYYQLQEKSVVSSLLQSHSSIELATQGVNDKTDTENFGIVGGNQVTIEAFKGLDRDNKQVLGVDMSAGRKEGERMGVFHPKLMVFEKDGKAVGGIFGTQNITPTLTKNSTMEEVLFFNNVAKDNENGLAILNEMQTVSKALISSQRAQAAELDEPMQRTYKSILEAELKGKSLNNMLVNRSVHDALKTRLTEAASETNSKGKVVLNIQYLENIFRPSREATGKPGEFSGYRSDLLDSMTKLAESGRLVIATSATSHDPGQGLFRLITDMRKLKDTTLEGDNQKAYDLYQTLLKNDAFKMQPTQFMHSKTAAFLDNDGNLVDLLMMSANYSYNSFMFNIELGMKLSRDNLLDLGVDRDNINRMGDYYGKALQNPLNKGLFAERKGVESAVKNTIALLEQAGGVNAATKKADRAKFTYSERYTLSKVEGGDTIERLTGLDIKMQDDMTFSITVGETDRYSFDPGSGQMINKKMPVIYINKGDRIMTGAFYTHKGTKSLDVAGIGRVDPGQTMRLNANDMLLGVIETLHHSYAFERQRRGLYKALAFLNKGDDLTNAITELTYISRGAPKDKKQQEAFDKEVTDTKASLVEILETGNLEGVDQLRKYITNLLYTSPEANDFYRQTVKQGKSEILAQILDVLSQPHELPYNANQTMESLPIYGAEHETLKALVRGYGDNITESSDDVIKLGGLIMSQIKLRHEDIVTVDGIPLLRSVSSVSRPEPRSLIDSPGALMKSRESSPKLTDMGLMNSTQGLRLLDAKQFRSKTRKALEAAGIDANQIESIVKRQTDIVFDLYRIKEQSEEEKQQGSDIPDNALLAFFPYPKTEQISQRLKNLGSVRPLLEASSQLLNYMSSFGYGKDNNINFGDVNNLITNEILSGMPSSQFSKFKQLMTENNNDIDKVKTILRQKALDVNDPEQGFLGSEERVLVSMGISTMSDYTYLNADQVKNRGYVFGHRTQEVISTNELAMSGAMFSQMLNDKLKIGALFVSRPLDISADNEDTKGLYELAKNIIQKELGTSIDEATAEKLKAAAKAVKDKSKIQGFKLVNGKGEFAPQLAQGVYMPEVDNNGKYSLKKIGGVMESGSFYIEGLERGAKTSGIDKVQYITLKAPAFAHREYSGISVLQDLSIGVVDGQPNMFTVNAYFLTAKSIQSGLRGSNVKGPMAAYKKEFFDLVENIAKFDNESMEEEGRIKLGAGTADRQTARVNQNDVYAIIGAGQMKGFVFNIGNSLLTKGDKSSVYKAIESKTDQSGLKVAEALALMFMKDDRVKEALKAAYNPSQSGESARIAGRSQFAATLNLMKIKEGGHREYTQGNVEDAYAPKMAIYEELIMLADKKYLTGDNAVDAEEAIKLTIIDALESGQGLGDLASRAKGLFDLTISEHGQALGSNRYSFDETNSRSGAMLAFFLKAASDLMSDIDMDKRKRGKAISEMGFIDKKDAANDKQSTVKKYLTDKDFAESRRAYGRAMGLYLDTTEQLAAKYNALKTAAPIGDVKTLSETDIEALISSKVGEELEMDLYMMYAQTQSNRYIEAKVDIGHNRIPVAVGMQDVTNLEGHYAAKMSKAQLDLYTKGSKDARAYGSLQDTLITLGAMVESQLGFMDKGQVRSHYTLKGRSVFEFGLAHDGFQINSLKAEEAAIRKEIEQLEDAETDTQKIEKARTKGDSIRQQADEISSLRLTMLFSEGYSRSAAKSLPRLLGNKVDGETRRGVISVAPAFDVFKEYVEIATSADSSNSGGNKTTRVLNALDYMTHTKELNSGIIRHEEASKVASRVEAMLDDYFTQIVDTESVVGKQAAALVEDMVSLLQLDRDIKSIHDVVKSGGTLGERFDMGIVEEKDKVTALIQQIEGTENDIEKERLKNQIVDMLKTSSGVTDATDNDGKVVDGIKINNKKYSPNETITLVKQLIAYNDNEVLTQKYNEVVDIVNTGEDVKTKIEEALKDVGAQERQRILAKALEAKYKDVSAGGSEDVTANQRLLQILTEKTTEGNTATVNTATEKDVYNITAAQNLIKGIQESTETDDIVVFEMMRNIIGKDFTDRIMAGYEMSAGKEYLLGRQQLRDMARTGIEMLQDSTDDASIRQVQYLQTLMTSVGKTQSFSVPALNITSGISEEGTYTAYVKPQDPATVEQGWILGLDILERVALVFPDFTSDVLEAQHDLAKKMHIAEQTGVLQKVTEFLTGENKTLELTAAEGNIYQDLRVASRRSRETALELVNNEKIMRNALGDQLGMKGASFIGMSSFLLPKDVVVFDKRMNTLFAGSSNINSLLSTLELSLSASDKDTQIAAAKSIITLGKILNEDFDPRITDDSKIVQEIKEALKTARKEASENTSKSSANIMRDYMGVDRETPATQLEKKLFRAQVLAARQGAPSTTGYGFASGRLAETIDYLNQQAVSTNSVMELDEKANRTVMMMSVMGNQFTQLGDYDGDSFQAAITRLAEASAALNNAKTQLDKAEADFNALENQDKLGNSAYIKHLRAQRQQEMREAADNLHDKITAVNSLQDKALQKGDELLRQYGEHFLGLPASFFESSAGGIKGGIKDEAIRDHFKQYRDTIASTYDHQKNINSWISDALKKTADRVDLAIDDQELFNTFLQEFNQARNVANEKNKDSLKTKRNQAVTLQDLIRPDSSQSTQALAEFKQLQQELIDFASIDAQNKASLTTLDKMVDKASAGALTMKAVSEVQAIIGSTGTGLLGQTYNTIIPLSTITTGKLAVAEAFTDKKGVARNILQQAATEMINAATEGGAEETFLQGLAAKYGTATGTQIPLELVSNTAKMEVSAIQGVLMNIQQYLRDAALKPKEKASVGIAASEFTLKGASGFSQAALKQTGLANILNVITDENERSKVMEQFITTSVGTKLNADFGLSSSDSIYADSDANKDLSTNELRAFGVLQMMNEYLSGKKTATEMIESSTFSGLLQRKQEEARNNVERQREAYIQRQEAKRSELIEAKAQQIHSTNIIPEESAPARRQALRVNTETTERTDKKALLKAEALVREERPDLFNSELLRKRAELEYRDISDKEIMDTVLVNMLAKFQASFIYDSMLEGNKQGALLSEEFAGIKAGYDIEFKSKKGVEEVYTRTKKQKNINKRRQEYRQQLMINAKQLYGATQGLRFRTDKEIADLAEQARQQAEIEYADAKIKEATEELATAQTEITERVITDIKEEEGYKRLKTQRIRAGEAKTASQKAWYLDKLENQGSKNYVSELFNNSGIIRENKQQEFKAAAIKLAKKNFAINYLKEAEQLRKVGRGNEIDTALEAKLLDIKAGSKNADYGIEALITEEGKSFINKQADKLLRAFLIKRVNEGDFNDLSPTNIVYTDDAATAEKAYIDEKLETPNDYYTLEDIALLTGLKTNLETAKNNKTTGTEDIRTAGEAAGKRKETELLATNKLTKDKKLTSTQTDTLNAEVNRFVAQEEAMQSVIIDALNAALNKKRDSKVKEALEVAAVTGKNLDDSAIAQIKQDTRLTNVEEAQTAFKSVIEETFRRRNQFLLDDETGAPGVLSKLIDINKTISEMKTNIDGVDLQNKALDIVNMAAFNLLSRGKTSATGVASVTNSVIALTNQLEGETDLVAKSSMLNLGGIDLPEVDQEIRSIAKDAAKEKILSELESKRDSAERIRLEELEDKIAKVTNSQSEVDLLHVLDDDESAEYRRVMQETGDSLRAIVTEVMTKKVTVDGKETSVAEHLAATQSASANAEEMARSVESLTRAKTDAEINNDSATLDMVANLTKELIQSMPKDGSEDMQYISGMLRRLNKDVTETARTQQRAAAAKVAKYNDKRQRKEYGVGGVLSLFAIPVLFGLAQGDVTFNDRVAATMTDIIQSAVTTTSYKDSAIRSALFGDDVEKDKSKLSRAEKRSQHAAKMLQIARVTESMRRSHSQTAGLAQGLAFELIFGASAQMTNKAAAAVFKNSATVRGAAEVASGLASMTIASIITKRPIPGTYTSYDHQWSITVKMLAAISNNMLMAYQQIINAQVEDQTVIYDEMTGGGLAAAFDSDFNMPEDGSPMSLMEKFMVSTLEMEEEIPVEDANYA